MKKKSFLENMLDSTVIYVAEKYGFGTEEDVLKKEKRDLEYHYLAEKSRQVDERNEEVRELTKEVKRLTEDKIRLLERDIQRLEYENQHYKQIAYKDVLQLEDRITTLAHVERFTYKENYIKCIGKNGLSRISFLEETELIRLLQAAFTGVHVAIEQNVLILTYTTSAHKKSKHISLERFVSMAEIEALLKKEGAQ